MAFLGQWKTQITRKGAASFSYFAPRYDYNLYFSAIGRDRWGGRIEIGFRTNPNGERQSTFEAYILRDQFVEIARLMAKADVQAAVRAFGTVLQELDVQER